jgi:acetyl-CoA C-acetyltransferase
MSEAYIISSARTPIGRFGGVFKDLSPIDLGAHIMRAALERAGLNGADLDLYIFGNVLRAGHGQLLPRQAAFRAGIPQEIDGYAVDMVCSGGMMAVNNAANFIRLGEADLVLAGGFESMSQAGFYLTHRARWGYKFLLGDPEQVKDIMLYDGLVDPMTDEGMGEQTERLVAEHGICRAELDKIAFESHRRAAEATEMGWFADEIAPVEIKTRKGTEKVARDEGIRPDTSLEALANLAPAFQENGVLTAGNSSQISDGAAALVLASQAAVEHYNLQPIARVLGCTWAAGETGRFPEAPIPAVKRLLDRLNMAIHDFDLFENNEAFAINNILFNRMLGVPLEQLNVFGGAVALGHPLGASGARIIVTLLNALAHCDGRLGLAAICHGTGGGTAMAVERIV